jgi:type II protein arginine methyltransferase
LDTPNRYHHVHDTRKRSGDRKPDTTAPGVFSAEPPLDQLTDDDRQQISFATMSAAVAAARQSLDAISEMIEQLADSSGRSTDVIPQSAVRMIPRWHFPMLNDLARTDAFAEALARAMPIGAHVLDIGSGTGLLAMMAVRAGAAMVTTCEVNPVLAELTRQIVARHGLSDVITVIPRQSTDLRVGVDLPRRADLIVTEIVDCGLVGEGLLPTVRHAREHLLGPDGQLIPESARMVGALVGGEAIERLNRVRTVAGFDVSLFNAVATPGHFPIRLATWPHRVLSEPMELASFDLANDPLTDGHTCPEIPVTASGEAHALVVWFEMTLGKGVTLSNSLDHPTSHWMQACVPLPAPIPVRAGRPVRLRLRWQGNHLLVTHPVDLTRSEVIP